MEKEIYANPFIHKTATAHLNKARNFKIECKVLLGADVFSKGGDPKYKLLLRALTARGTIHASGLYMQGLEEAIEMALRHLELEVEELERISMDRPMKVAKFLKGQLKERNEFEEENIHKIPGSWREDILDDIFAISSTTDEMLHRINSMNLRELEKRAIKITTADGKEIGFEAIGGQW